MTHHRWWDVLLPTLDCNHLGPELFSEMGYINITTSFHSATGKGLQDWLCMALFELHKRKSKMLPLLAGCCTTLVLPTPTGPRPGLRKRWPRWPSSRTLKVATVVLSHPADR